MGGGHGLVLLGLPLLWVVVDRALVETKNNVSVEQYIVQPDGLAVILQCSPSRSCETAKSFSLPFMWRQCLLYMYQSVVLFVCLI